MASGWGAVGAGAWGGGGTANKYEENEYDNAPPSVPPPAPAAAPTPAGGWGTSNPTFAGQEPAATNLASNSFSAQGAGAGGFGSSAGAYGKTPSAGAGSSGTMTEAQLRRKEAELAAKEKQLKDLEKTLTEAGALAKRKNWPRCYPILYQNIPEEIPEGGARRCVREAYFAWYGLVICLIWNTFCASVMLGYKVDQKVPSWFLAILYLLLGIPLGFWLWYRRLYNGAKADSTLGFVGFFIWFIVHTGFCIWSAIAIPFSANQWSFAGFVTAMEALNVSTFAGIIYLVGSSLWTLESLFSLWVIKDVFLFFRGQGGIQQAKEQAAMAAFKHTVANAGSQRV